MIIQSLELSNYRNYNTLFIDFSNKINILYGDNAQGKTNILEAIYLCATTKSHRGSRDKEIIKINENESHIRMIIEKRDITRRLDMHLKKNKSKGAAIDGMSIKKSSELFGLIHVVSFSPEDLSIIKNGPSERRRFMDMELCQLDKVYLHNLSIYNKTIIQRNNLLKQIGHDRKLIDTVFIWDEQLVKYGSEIILRRNKFIDELNTIIRGIHSHLTTGKENIFIDYNIDTDIDKLKNILSHNIEKDIRNKSTGYGPHRDDLIFYIQGKDVRKYGSQGQQRTAALSLKLAEIELVRNNIEDEPVLLLDDVLSELDRNRQNKLIEGISETQTIITCTGMEEFVKNRINIDKIYHVINGMAIEDNYISH